MKRIILITIILAALVAGCGTVEVRDPVTKEVECSFMLMPWHFINIDAAIEKKCGIEIE